MNIQKKAQLHSIFPENLYLAKAQDQDDIIQTGNTSQKADIGQQV